LTDNEPRILIVSQRSYYAPVYRCSAYEFEDTICAVDHAELLLPSFEVSVTQRLFDKISEHGNICIQHKRRRLALPKLTKYYDVLLVSVGFWHELFDLEPILKCLRERCRVIICIIEELWAKGVVNHERFYRLLEKFDHILLGLSGTCDALARFINTPIMHLPFGVDMDRFCPYPNPPQRKIDVYAMGHCSSKTDYALREWADRTGATYLYDTANRGRFVMSVERHRNFLAQIIKRSRYFIVNPAKIDDAEQTGGQMEIGPRFYEGGAGGAVLIGQVPTNCQVFDRDFDWTDAVIDMPFHSTDIAERISALDAEPDRIARIRLNNVVNCLRRHDWVYRWNNIIKILGMEPTPCALERAERLRNLADRLAKSAAAGQLILAPTAMW
jgi:Glycosyl transferases group 1